MEAPQQRGLAAAAAAQHQQQQEQYSYPPDMEQQIPVQHQQTDPQVQPFHEEQYISPAGPPPGYQQPQSEPTQNAHVHAYEYEQAGLPAPMQHTEAVSANGNGQQQAVYELEAAPGLPQRPPHNQVDNYVPMGLSKPIDNHGYTPPPPPRRQADPILANNNDPSDPINYMRNPSKVVAYLIPFPKPVIKGVDVEKLPTRFMLFTPPPPPLHKPGEGEKEGNVHKVQRKWQEEVRSAKSSSAKPASWEGVKSRATKAIAWGVNKTTTSNLEFLGRLDGGNQSDSDRSDHEDNQKAKKTRVDEMLLVYPPTMSLTDEQMREEFVNTMLRTKSKAQRDSIIATGLLPVGYGIDILATFIWPFGGLGEIDTVWLYSSVRGAKTARSVTKRLTPTPTSSSNDPNNKKDDTLKLSFTASPRLDILQRYLEAECHHVDPTHFTNYRSAPTETDVLEAIGWAPSQTGGREKNWEEERWELTEVKEDLKSNMHKGAKEWKKFVAAFQKDPEKALKKK